MYFTREDILAIHHGLAKLAIRDSQLPTAKTPLNYNDIVTLVQDDKNVQIKVSDFIEQLHLIAQDDFMNITDKFDEAAISIIEAIRLVPTRSRKIGLVITFENTEGNWEIWQYCSHNLLQWNNPHVWVKLESNKPLPPNCCEQQCNEGVIGPTKPDKHDKPYNPSVYSGLGRIHLKKNVVKTIDYVSEIPITKNLLTQRVLCKENVIYIIEYDYDLNGQTIIIPSNCELRFEGGSIKNGTIKFNNTKITGVNTIQEIGNVVISEDSTFRKGQMLYDELLSKPKWFNGEKWIDSTGAEV